ncbi:hypothetical protein DXG01_007523 [Tephrocybe rancida]|nr:hypothetical protein DXG01_007523 [Tephrocybe rancida]
MGRPKLYHTPEEVRAANNAKSKRSYERNKADVNARRATQYRTKSGWKETTKPTRKRRTEIDAPLDNRGRQPKKGIAFWTKITEGFAEKHSVLIGESRREYVDNLYHNFSITHRKNGIRDAIDEHDAIQRGLHKSQEEILQLDGIGKGWERSNEVLKGVRDVMHAIEELLITCETLSSDALELMHQNKELMYQQW